MSKQDTGGAAHPQVAQSPASGNVHRVCGGMTLLDWFAGQALAGLADFMERDRSNGEDDHFLAKRTSRYAYDIAAAMVAEKRLREASDE